MSENIENASLDAKQEVIEKIENGVHNYSAEEEYVTPTDPKVIKISLLVSLF